MRALDVNNVVVVYHRREIPDGDFIGFVVVTREGIGWKSVVGGGLATSRPPGAKVVFHAGPPEDRLTQAFIFGHPRDPAIRSVPAAFPDGAAREDRPQKGLFLFVFDPQVPPCQLRFLDESGGSVEVVDLREAAPGAEVPPELLEKIRERCP